MDELLPPLCTLCEYLDPSGAKKCVAFPEGIPPEVWSNQHPHFTPYQGERVVFKRASDVEPDQVAAWQELHAELQVAGVAPGLPQEMQDDLYSDDDGESPPEEASSPQPSY